MSHEAADRTLLDRLIRPGLPLDLLAVIGYVVIAVALLSRPGVYGSPLAVALGLPLLLFVPGYALVSFLFPGATPDDAADRLAPSELRHHGLGGVQRVALGFGLSVSLLPILGLGIALSPWPIDPSTVLLSVSGLAVGLAVGGAIRRFRRPADRRFTVPFRAWLDDGRRAISDGSVTETALNLGLAVAVVVSVVAVGYAVAVPGPDQSYTSVTLLSQNDTGELVTADYPREFVSGESRPITVSVTNHEGHRVSYSVVVELQRVRQAGDGSANVTNERRLVTFTPTLRPGATWQTRHDVTPTMTGQNLRLVYLVYQGEPPEDPTTTNAYRHVHVWINVTQ